MPSRARWAGATLLAAGVAAIAIAVPPVVLSWAGDDDTPDSAPAPTVTTGPTAAATTSPPPTAVVTTTPPTTPARTPVSTPTATRKPTPAAFRPVTIDAADPANERYDIGVTDCPSCESGRRVQYLGQGHALVVHVRDVPAAGRRTLTIVYTSAERRQLDVKVNDEKPATLTLDGAGSWEIPVRTTIPVQLPAGDSEIMFLNPRGPAPDLDRLIVS